MFRDCSILLANEGINNTSKDNDTESQTVEFVVNVGQASCIARFDSFPAHCEEVDRSAVTRRFA